MNFINIFLIITTLSISAASAQTLTDCRVNYSGTPSLAKSIGAKASFISPKSGCKVVSSNLAGTTTTSRKITTAPKNGKAIVISLHQINYLPKPGSKSDFFAAQKCGSSGGGSGCYIIEYSVDIE